MRDAFYPDAQRYASANRRKRRWYRVVMCLAAVVVFVTTYALILPAITMEKTCDIPVHVHTDACYADVVPEPQENEPAEPPPDDVQEPSDAEPVAEDGGAAPSDDGQTVPELTGAVPEPQQEPLSPQETPEEEPTAAEPPQEEPSQEEPSQEEPAAEEAPKRILICGMEEHTHSEACQSAAQLADERLAQEQELTRQVTELEMLEALTDEDRETADALLAALAEAHRQEQLSDELYTDLYSRTLALLTQESSPEGESGEDSVNYAAIAEPCESTNWMLLRDSGWFEAYSNYGDYGVSLMSAAPDDTSPSSVQVDNPGGENSDDDVTVSKTIAGTDIENVFDITLTVETPQNIDEIIKEPDMAVVIVMDISNTMKDKFTGSGDKTATRYKAAVEAAENFLDKFANENTLGISKVGYVAFNTDVHQIFDLSQCTNATQANALKNIMRNATGEIINMDGYSVAHNRFTNIEGGLKMAQDMLKGVSNKNKFIILLTDGFPTTYLESGYAGYDPYDETGRFYDHVLNVPCSSGTSYSDEAAIRARKMANSIKASGTTIFSIGVDVAGQTIQKYITTSEKLAADEAKISIVDRTGTTYEIGSATSTEAYKNWLKSSIGSEYYYDSTNTQGLKDAYAAIFTAIQQTVTAGSQADWVASDPIPNGSLAGDLAFVGMYDKDEKLQQSLTGQHAEDSENTATFSEESYAISWDLKASGYQTETRDGKQWHIHQLTYRVRLKNEDSNFAENAVYPTNKTTTLRYRVVQSIDNQPVLSESKTINFPIPSVHGYLGELEFTKQDNRGNALAGAEFRLCHDTASCSVCCGDGETAVTVPAQIATSDDSGTVRFTRIPSGHIYTLEETVIPPGYFSDGSTYSVKVAYDKVTVTVTKPDNTQAVWGSTGGISGSTASGDGNAGDTDTIINETSYELPKTGGSGTTMYTTGGLMLIAAALLLWKLRRKEERS